MTMARSRSVWGFQDGYAREGKDRTDYRGYGPSAWTFCTSQVEIMRHHLCGPRPFPTVSHRPHSPHRPHRPHPCPTVLNSLWPSYPSAAVPSRPSPLPCTNISHRVGPAVLSKDGHPTLMTDGTDYSQPSHPVWGSCHSPPDGWEHCPSFFHFFYLSSRAVLILIKPHANAHGRALIPGRYLTMLS